MKKSSLFVIAAFVFIVAFLVIFLLGIQFSLLVGTLLVLCTILYCYKRIVQKIKELFSYLFIPISCEITGKSLRIFKRVYYVYVNPPSYQNDILGFSNSMDIFFQKYYVCYEYYVKVLLKGKKFSKIIISQKTYNRLLDMRSKGKNVISLVCRKFRWEKSFTETNEIPIVTSNKVPIMHNELEFA